MKTALNQTNRHPCKEALLEFQNKKTSIQKQLSKLIEFNSIAAKKISTYKEQRHKLLEQVNSLQNQINIRAKTKIHLLILPPLILATAGALALKYYNIQIIAIFLISLAVLLFLYLTIKERIKKEHIKKIIGKKNKTEDTINKIDEYLENTDKKCRMAYRVK